MKKQWTDRKWDKTKTEERFEHLLEENGFTVNGVKEYNSKTDYLIEKDGVECEYSLHHIDNKSSRGTECFKAFMMYYNIKVEYENVKSLQKNVLEYKKLYVYYQPNKKDLT